MSQTLEICQVPNYQVNYSKSKKIIKPLDSICAILEQDFQLHERLHKEDKLILSVDVDKLTRHNPNGNLEQVLTDISLFIGCEKNEISYTTNFSVEAGSHHLSIPKYWMSTKEQKQLWVDFQAKYNYGKEIDTGIFDKDVWFRLPNQTKEGIVGTEHVIQHGETKNFILKYIDEATEYKRQPLVLGSTPIIKKPSKKSTIKQTETNLVEFNEMNFIEIKHLINSGCFKNHCGHGSHNEWVCIGGMFKFLFPNNWFDLWSILTIQFGTDNKKKEYDNQSRFINPIGSDHEKVMNTLRMWAKKENPEGWKLWVREEIRLKKLNKTVLPIEITADDVSIKTDKESEIDDDDELEFLKSLENETPIKQTNDKIFNIDYFHEINIDDDDDNDADNDDDNEDEDDEDDEEKFIEKEYPVFEKFIEKEYPVFEKFIEKEYPIFEKFIEKKYPIFEDFKPLYDINLAVGIKQKKDFEKKNEKSEAKYYNQIKNEKMMIDKDNEKNKKIYENTINNTINQIDKDNKNNKKTYENDIKNTKKQIDKDNEDNKKTYENDIKNKKNQIDKDNEDNKKLYNKNKEKNKFERIEKQKQKKDFIRDKNEKKLFQKRKEYFERFHIKIISPILFIRIGSDQIEIISKSSLIDIHTNLKDNFIHDWLKCETMRTYEYVSYLPPPCVCPETTYNLYSGLIGDELLLNHEIDETLIKEKITIFMKQFWLLTGKNNKGLEYLLNYLAHMIQKPGELPRTSICFKSLQGVGKNVAFEKFADKLLGSKYLLATAKIDDILGRFPLINQKLLVLMDEAQSKDTFSNSETIKSYITAERLTYEKKGIDGIQILNTGRMLFFTNNEKALKIEQSDRRFSVFECANDFRNNKDYFKSLIKAFDNEELLAYLFYFFKNRDISNFDPTNDRVQTNIYLELKNETIPDVTRFILYKYEEDWINIKTEFIEELNDEDKHDKLLKSDKYYNEYKQWCKEVEYKPKSQMYFVKTFIKNICQVKRTNTGRFITINVNELKEFVKNNELIELDQETEDIFSY
jgi:hypothetical protein